MKLCDSHSLDSLPISAPDLVYIDGDHTEHGCYADLLLAEKSGAKVILCDDYNTPIGPEFGVKTAIDRFCHERNIQGKIYDNGSTGLFQIELKQKNKIELHEKPKCKPCNKAKDIRERINAAKK